MEDVIVRDQPNLGRAARRIWDSTLGQKYVMALTGLALVGFIVAHLAGNLLVFKGPDALNGYARGLRELGGLLWAARAGLLVAAVLHVWAAVKLTLRSREARPVKYAMERTRAATYASRTMRMSGVIVLLFLIYHLLHFTFGVTDPAHFADHADPLGGNVYRMVVSGFQQWPVAVAYIVAQLLLGMHMSHGISSMFQSLGAIGPQYRPAIRKIGPVLGWGLALGNISMPVAVLAGVITL